MKSAGFVCGLACIEAAAVIALSRTDDTEGGVNSGSSAGDGAGGGGAGGGGAGGGVTAFGAAAP
jgi:hypothetical protein